MIRPEDEELTIRTGGKTLGGWTEVRVTRGVERLPSDFEITLTEKYPGQAAQAIVEPGATCEVMLSGDKILTGFIDRYMPGYDRGNHTVRIIGRSTTEDIVDCSVDTDALGGWEIHTGTVRQAVERLIKPYNVTLKMPDGDADIPTGSFFSVYPGYPCYALIEEMARAVAMIVWDDADGNLIISKGGTAGRAGSALVEGINVEAASGLYGMDQRFSRYLVAMQQANNITGHLDAWGEAKDVGVKRNRLKVILPEAPFTIQFAQLRADWERAWRFGHSRRAALTVTGWRDGNDKLWQPNSMVSCQLPRLKIAEDRVISEVTWYRGERGTLSYLTVMEKQGLTPRPFLPINPLGPNAGTVTTETTNQVVGP